MFFVHYVHEIATARTSAGLLLLLFGAGCATHTSRPDIVTTSAARRDVVTISGREVCVAQPAPNSNNSRPALVRAAAILISWT